MAKTIVSLGNPDSKYYETRRNIGFMVIDRLAKDFDVTFSEEENFKAEVGSCFINGEKVYLVRPTTSTNNSGITVHALLTYYSIDIEDFLMIYDDLDMEVGCIRLCQKDSAGGYNSIESIIVHTGTQALNRARVDTGRPKRGHSVANHVLRKLDQGDYITVTSTLEKVNEAVRFYLQEANLVETMQEFNGQAYECY